MADLNAKHQFMGHTYSNSKGVCLALLNTRRILKHIGPHFPTFYNYNTASTPDTVLTNARAYHNYRITLGPETSSDHATIRLELDEEPIFVPIHPRHQTSKTDWSTYTELLSGYRQPELNGATLEVVDNSLEDLTNHIVAAINELTPVITLPYIKLSHEARTLQILIRNTQEQLRQQYTRQHYTLLTQYRRQLQEEIRKLNQISWEELLSGIKEDDLTQLWKAVNRCMGTQAPPTYL